MSQDRDYPFFKAWELRCRCGCGPHKMDEQFMLRIVVPARRELDFSFTVTSAYRCPEHNGRVSKTGPAGPHTTGRAIDIAVNSRQRYLLSQWLYEYGITRIGNGRSFIHFDNLTEAEGFDEEVAWPY